METIEITAKSLDEAKTLAAAQLGVPAAQVAVTLLEEVKGLFGKSSVRVSASASSVEEAPKKGRKAAPPKAEKPAPVAIAEPTPAPKKERATKTAVVEPKVEAETDEEEVDTREPVVATQADADALIEIIEEILELSDLEAHVITKDINDRYVNLELDGKDVAYLVGKHGEVLNALQYLVNVISTRQIGSGVRVTIDGNHYRTRREEALKSLALQIAEQVNARGEEAVLDALPAFERRVVHKALLEFDGITTYSEGEEPNRRVVIAPST